MEIITIAWNTLVFAIIAFLSVFSLSVFFKLALKETLPRWMGVILGIAFAGVGNDLNYLINSPSPEMMVGFIAVVASSLLAVNIGNRYADRLIEKNLSENGYHLLKRSLYMASGKKFIEIAMPRASDIHDIYGKRQEVHRDCDASGIRYT